MEGLSEGAGRDPIAIPTAVKGDNGLVFNPEAKQYSLDWLGQLKSLRLQKRANFWMSRIGPHHSNTMPENTPTI